MKKEFSTYTGKTKIAIFFCSLQKLGRVMSRMNLLDAVDRFSLFALH